MSLKTISGWLKFIVVLMGLCCFAAQSAVSLIFLVSEVEEIHNIAAPWLIFIWTTAIPMLFAMIYAWKTASNIGNNNSFSVNNAKNLHYISLCAGVESAIILIGNIVMLPLNMSHPSVMIIALFIVAVGIIIMVAAECLSQLIKRATKLQTEADLTI